jgi:hypothetical protein
MLFTRKFVGIPHDPPVVVKLMIPEYTLEELEQFVFTLAL